MESKNVHDEKVGFQDSLKKLMSYNKFTLSFTESEEQKFNLEYFKSSIFQLRVAFILLIFLYSSFGYLDTLIIPEFADIFHLIRYAFVVPFLLIVFFLSYTSIFPKIWQILLLISFIIGGTGISIMTMYAPENYAYYAGMMLVFFAGYYFVKLRFFYATIAGWILLIIYNLGTIFYTDASNLLIINNNFFFISANLIGMLGAYNNELYSRSIFFLNQKLEQEKLHEVLLNQNLEAIVKERTNELLIAKQKAEESEANITAIIEGTYHSIWAFNKKHEILYINNVFQQEFFQTFGVYLEKGTNLVDCLPENLRPLWQPRYDRVLSNEQFTVEDAIESENGTIYIQVSLNPIVKDGEVIGGSCFGSNISERKRTEIELIKSKEKAEESDRLKSAFLANMSHEIRTPMNGILGFAQLLKEPNLSGNEQLEFISIIEKSGKRMLNIINDIIDISKIEAGLMKLNMQSSNINEQIEYIYSFFKPEADSKNIILNFNLSLSSKESIINTDKEKLFAILTNLVKNSIKYTHYGSIDFGYNVVKNDIESFLIFYVKDTGIGIPKSRQQAIFERFIQADIIDRKAYQGAGLGLAITKAYVEMLGGKIWVESDEGKGSTFYFTLPYIYVNDEINNSHEVIETNFNDNLNKLNVMIAEDDKVSLVLLEKIIGTLNANIITVSTGKEAIDVCRHNNNIDLILMDVQMPLINGYEAVRQIRKFNKEIIIIAQTAYGLSGDNERALEAGCNDYITKPINKDKLLRLIDKHCNKPK